MVYTVRILIIWLINECVITFLAIFNVSFLKVGGHDLPPAPGSDTYAGAAKEKGEEYSEFYLR